MMDASIVIDNLRVATAALVITVAALILARNYFFSKQLKLPPGPPGWPIIGNLLDLFRDTHCRNENFIFSKYCREYGDIYKVKFGSRMMYILSDVAKVREVFANSKILGRVPGAAYKIAIGPEATGFFFSSSSEWKPINRFTRDLFRDVGVGKQMFSQNILSEIERFVTKMDTLAGEPCSDLPELLHIATSNIICGVVFGYQHDYDDEGLREVIRLLRTTIEAAGPGFTVMTSKLLCKLPFGPGKRLMTSLREFKSLVEGYIVEARSSATSNESAAYFVEQFLEEQDKGNVSFSDGNLVACCLDLFGAGTETSSTSILWAILCLTTHPKVQEIAQQELDAFIEEHAGMPTYADRSKLPYLLAMILEIERIASVNVIATPHETEEDLQLFGYDFPKGTAVACNFLYVYMDPDRFPDPYEFKPERFIIDGHFESHPDMISFSVGRRTCPGEQLARMEIFLFVTRLLHRYKFKAPDGVAMPSITDAVHGIVRSPYPFSVVFTKRYQ